MKQVLLLTIFLSVAVGAQGPVLGTLEGKVLGDDGTAIVGARVAIRRFDVTPEARRPAPPTRNGLFEATTGPAGAFRFESIPVGRYSLCARAAPGSLWLDSCDWGSQPLSVDASSERSEILAITMRQGLAVSVRIGDPGELLQQHEQRTPGAHLLVGIGGEDKLFRPARLVARSATERIYQGVIPFDTSIKLVVSSSMFRLADLRGTPIDGKTAIVPVRVSTGMGFPVVELLITGTRNP